MLAVRRRAREGLAWLDEKPLVVVLVAASATIATSGVMSTHAGWPLVLRVVFAVHTWRWLVICLVGEVAAYGGYVMTVRDMARVDDGARMNLGLSLKVVVGGFGVFAATRGSGGFVVDYWAFRHAGAGKREALARILGLGFLEYAMLSVAALGASALLFFGLDGHAGYGVTLPALLVVPISATALWATSPTRVGRLSRPHGGAIKRKLANGVAGANYVRRLLTDPREHGLGLVGIIIYWGGDILCLWAALQIVGGRITAAALVLAYAGGYVLTRRALPAGGAGLVELALTAALVGMGVRFVPALVGVIIYRLFNFWLPIIPALFVMPAINELRSRLRADERHPG